MARVAVDDGAHGNGARRALCGVDEGDRDRHLDVVADGRRLPRTCGATAPERAKERLEDVGAAGTTGTAAEEVAKAGAAERGRGARVGVRVEAWLGRRRAEPVKVGALLVVGKDLCGGAFERGAGELLSVPEQGGEEGTHVVGLLDLDKLLLGVLLGARVGVVLLCELFVEEQGGQPAQALGRAERVGGRTP